MKYPKTPCHWCSKSYVYASRYAEHLAKAHPEKDLWSLREESRSPQRQSSGIGNPNGTSEINLDMSPVDASNSDPETEDEGSDKEAREFSVGSESDGEGPLDNEIPQLCAGISIREHTFPERDPNYNLYAPFQHHTDYRLARFFNAAKIIQSEDCLTGGSEVPLSKYYISSKVPSSPEGLCK